MNIGLSLGFSSAEHCLSMDVALLPGSYVLDPSIELTGGIAVYVWTGGGRAGDFVISLGGYHPDYNVPAHYPRPQRLGFVWSPAGDITVRAEAYAAITPAAFMFGGRLAAVYDKGVFSAWFTAHLDVLAQWKPFYLDVRLGISIGVAATIKVWFVRVRISVEVGSPGRAGAACDNAAMGRVKPDVEDLRSAADTWGELASAPDPPTKRR
ncbi:hypothetical protein H0E86_30875 [Streptomyces sp. SCSIO-PteL053]|nr:hypothetical protein H0E86_30875 [Streptomyces sp. SCSIO-PteL053]